MTTAAENEIQKARQISLTYLSARARSIHEVREKLRKEGFADGAVGQVIADLQRLSLLDDREFARRWIESRLARKPAGARKFRQDLQHKGIEQELIAEVLEEFREDLDSETAAVGLLSQQRWRYNGLDELKAKRRMLGLLARRGYEQDVARKAVEQVWEEMQSDEFEGD